MFLDRFESIIWQHRNERHIRVNFVLCPLNTASSNVQFSNVSDLPSNQIFLPEFSVVRVFLEHSSKLPFLAEFNLAHVSCFSEAFFIFFSLAFFREGIFAWNSVLLNFLFYNSALYFFGLFLIYISVIILSSCLVQF